MSKTALLVIDVQNSFRHRPSWDHVSDPDIVKNVSRLVDAARDRDHAVHWIWHADPGTGSVFDPAMGLVTPQPGLAPRAHDLHFTKTSRNALSTTNLAQTLTKAGTRHLVISGIQTEQCCETTARAAADLGFEVTFVTEATATFPLTRPDTGATMSAEAMIERTEFALAGRFARIATIDTAFDDAAPHRA